MNATELKDRAFAEGVAKLQRKVFSNEISQEVYEEQYESLRSSWVVSNETKNRVSLIIN